MRRRRHRIVTVTRSGNHPLWLRLQPRRIHQIPSAASTLRAPRKHHVNFPRLPPRPHQAFSADFPKTACSVVPRRGERPRSRRTNGPLWLRLQPRGMHEIPSAASKLRALRKHHVNFPRLPPQPHQALSAGFPDSAHSVVPRRGETPRPRRTNGPLWPRLQPRRIHEIPSAASTLRAPRKHHVNFPRLTPQPHQPFSAGFSDSACSVCSVVPRQGETPRPRRTNGPLWPRFQPRGMHEIPSAASKPRALRKHHVNFPRLPPQPHQALSAGFPDSAHSVVPRLGETPRPRRTNGPLWPRLQPRRIHEIPSAASTVRTLRRHHVNFPRLPPRPHQPFSAGFPNSACCVCSVVP
jgi:hypothetical protein